MEIKEKIEYYENQNKLVEGTKNELINSHIEQINQVIENKILELKDKLRAEAIEEVCGEEYNILNKELDKNNKYIEILKAMEGEDDFIVALKDIIPVATENGSEMPETFAQDNLQTENKTIEETTVVGTNQDTLDGMLN